MGFGRGGWARGLASSSGVFDSWDLKENRESCNSRKYCRFHPSIPFFCIPRSGSANTTVCPRVSSPQLATEAYSGGPGKHCAYHLRRTAQHTQRKLLKAIDVDPSEGCKRRVGEVAGSACMYPCLSSTGPPSCACGTTPATSASEPASHAGGIAEETWIICTAATNHLNQTAATAPQELPDLLSSPFSPKMIEAPRSFSQTDLNQIAI